MVPRSICWWRIWTSGLCFGLLEVTHAAEPLSLNCSSELTEVQLSADATIALNWGADENQMLLLLEELGYRVQAGNPDLRHIDIPPRLGLWFGPVRRHSPLAVSEVRPGTVLRFRCVEPHSELQAWLEQVARLAGDLGTHVGSTADVALDYRLLQELIESAHDPKTAALAKHLYAQSLLMSGQSAAASEAFAVAASGWQTVDDGLRETAALLARAEDLNRKGAYRLVIEETTEELLAALPDSYYRARLINARCVAHSKLGAFDAATACYSRSIAELQRLGELAEVAAARVDLGTLLRRRGALAEAHASFLLARSDAMALGSWNAAGRAEYGLADLACDAVDLADCLSRLQMSVEFFQLSRSYRWEAAALLRLARELSRMGTFEDAEQVLASALPLIDPVNAPSLWANAQVELAHVLDARGEIEGAVAAIDSAIEIYRRIGNMYAQETATVIRDRIALGGQTEANVMAPKDLVAAPGRRYTAALNEAEWAIRAGKSDLARSKLRALARSSKLGLSERMRARQLEIRAAADYPNVRDVIQKAIVSARRLLAATQSPRLQWIARRSLQPLRMDAVDGWLRHHARFGDGGGEFGEAEVEALLGWLVLDALLLQSSSLHPQHGDSDRARAVTQVTGVELLAALDPEFDSDAGRQKARTLLALFADEAGKEGSDSVDESQLPLLPSLRARLGANDRVLIPLRGREYWLFILVDAADIRMATFADNAKLDRQLRILAVELARRESDARQVFELADGLSEAVLAPLDLNEAIDHLYIVHTELAAEFPWGLMSRGNGDQQPLAATWSLLHISSGEPWPKYDDGNPSLYVHIAAQAQGNGGLAPLNGIDAELEGLPSRLQDRLAINRTGRAQAWLEDIGRPGAWVHLSAHGNLSAGRVAGSGIWFDPIEQGNGGMPEYLSWLDLVEHPVQAELVVLNACQLGPADSVNRGFSGNLATALISSGARHVIAARWPISDSAARMWTPAFYSRLSEVPASPAVALNAAREVLRRSRAFRHPYHWAGWVHHEHWRLQASPLRIAAGKADLAIVGKHDGQ